MTVTECFRKICDMPKMGFNVPLKVNALGFEGNCFAPNRINWSSVGLRALLLLQLLLLFSLALHAFLQKTNKNHLFAQWNDTAKIQL